jgi:hypothetical protein
MTDVELPFRRWGAHHFHFFPKKMNSSILRLRSGNYTRFSRKTEIKDEEIRGEDATGGGGFVDAVARLPRGKFCEMLLSNPWQRNAETGRGKKRTTSVSSSSDRNRPAA